MIVPGELNINLRFVLSTMLVLILIFEPATVKLAVESFDNKSDTFKLTAVEDFGMIVLLA